MRLVESVLVTVVAIATQNVIVYPDRLTGCNLIATRNSAAKMASVLVNSDSVTTAGLDVSTVLGDSATMELINSPVPVLPGTYRPDQLEECPDITALIESFGQVASSFITNRNPEGNSKLVNVIGAMLDDHIVALDGSKLPMSYEELSKQYYYQGLVTPSVIMLPGCVEPEFNADVESAALNLYELTNTHLARLSDEIFAMTRACNHCLPDMIKKIGQAIGWTPDAVGEEYDAMESDISGVEKTASDVISEVLTVPKDKFPTTIGDLVVTGSKELFKRVENLPRNGGEDAQSSIVALDQLYSEVAGFTDHNIINALDQFYTEMGC